MASTFRWIVLFAVALILTALFQPFLDKFLERIGWFSAPGDAVDMAMNWLEQLVGVSAFPWLAGITFGLAAGSWIDSVLRRLDGRHPLGKVARGRAVASEASLMALRLQQYLGNPFLHQKSGPTLWIESMIVLDKLKRLGIDAPDEVDGPFSNERVERLCIYFQIVAPLLREGDLASAKGLVASLNRDDTRTVAT
jgi:hypothetical protein